VSLLTKAEQLDTPVSPVRMTPLQARFGGRREQCRLILGRLPPVDLVGFFRAGFELGRIYNHRQDIYAQLGG